MSDLKSLAVAAAICIGFSGIAVAQQPTYPGRYGAAPDRYSATSDRYSTAPDRVFTMPAQGRTSTDRDRYATQRAAVPERRPSMAAGQFASEGTARANCGNNTVVWVNTKSHV